LEYDLERYCIVESRKEQSSSVVCCAVLDKHSWDIGYNLFGVVSEKQKEKAKKIKI